MTLKWDERFLSLAQHVSTWSKDPSTQVGAVIVDERRLIVSIGYNGFPPGVRDEPFRLDNRDLKLQMTIHAEENALLSAGRRMDGCTIYVWPCEPCGPCAAKIIRAGIRRIVSPPLEQSHYSRWRVSIDAARTMYAEAGVEIVSLDMEDTDVRA